MTKQPFENPFPTLTCLSLLDAVASHCVAMLCLFQGRGGGGGFATGEFRRENFPVKEGGEIFPCRTFGGTVPYFATAAGIVSSESFGDFKDGDIFPWRNPPPPCIAQCSCLSLYGGVACCCLLVPDAFECRVWLPITTGC